jgi:DNA-3-methyladenine glycosylase
MFLIREDHGDTMVGRIVETEAYLATQDPACHGARGLTPRNATMFGPPGYAYVYAIHRSHCINVVTEAPGQPSAVLIRALEPVHGLDAMHRRRRVDHAVRLTSGPGKLCQALAIDRALDAWDLTRGRRLWIAAPVQPAACIITVTPRIGVTSAHDLPLRFHEAANPFVSPGKSRKS